MKVSVFYLPSIGSRAEIEAGMAGLRNDLYQKMLSELTEQAQAADQLGYDSISFTEHHFHIEGFELSTNPILLDLYVAMQTERIRVGQLGIVLPAHNPLRVAEDIMSAGEARRAWLGFEVDAGAEDIWGRTQGIVVGSVSPDSPAARARISRGDRIVSVDGQPLHTPLDFESILLDMRAGESIAVGIEGRSSAVTLVSEGVPSVSADRVTALEQMQLVTVTPGIRAERNLRYESGALILSIESQLESRIGFRAGDVILRIDRAGVTSAEQAATIFRRASGNMAVYIERNGGVIVRQLSFRRSRG